VNLLEANNFGLRVGETCFELLDSSMRFDEVFSKKVRFFGSFDADDVLDKSVE
jgi:hypothetical protein